MCHWGLQNLHPLYDNIRSLYPVYNVTTRTGALGRRLSNHKVFLKTKDSRFFANGTIEFKVQLCNRWKLLNRLNLPDVSGKSTQIYECYRSRFAKKTWESFVFKKSCDWMIFQVPRFEKSHCKIRQFLLWCEIHYINEITGSGTYSLLF